MTATNVPTRAYRASQYSAGGVAFRIGRHCPDLDRLLAALGTRTAVLLTSCNPRSVLRPPSANARRMAALRRLVRRWRSVPGESGARRWREAQILLAGPLAFGLRLAHRFGQNAILLLNRGARPRLVLL